MRNLTIKVIYRDDDWFIIDKPYDCRIQNYANAKDPSGSYIVLNYKLDEVIHSTEKNKVESLLKEQFPGISKFRNVHQLDYATSGIFVLALNKKAAAAASKLFRDRTVKKTYLALVNGHVKEDEYFVDQPIDDDPNHGFRMAIVPTGKPAQTKIRVLQRGYYTYKEDKTGIEKTLPVTKVSLSPISGRRHQLRLHLKHIGHPIVGDFNYEDEYTDTFRMMLHAHQIVLPLPDREELKVVADDPFSELVAY